MELFQTILGLALFGSVVWALIAFSIITILFFVADATEDGYIATITFVIAGAVFYFFGRETFNTIAALFTFKNLFIYFLAGLFHAFVRIFFYGRTEKAKMIEYNQYEHIKKDPYKPNYDGLKSNVFRWWFLWPVSMIVWIVKDFAIEVYDYVYGKFEKFFKFIMDLGMKSVIEKK